MAMGAEIAARWPGIEVMGPWGAWGMASMEGINCLGESPKNESYCASRATGSRPSLLSIIPIA